MWIAGCPSLDVYSQGESEAEATRNLQEAVELWMDSCIERNTLSAALQELGWFRIPAGVSLPGDTDTIEVVREEPEFLGRRFALEVTVPAYQASLFSGGDEHVAH